MAQKGEAELEPLDAPKTSYSGPIDIDSSGRQMTPRIGTMRIFGAGHPEYGPDARLLAQNEARLVPIGRPSHSYSSRVAQRSIWERASIDAVVYAFHSLRLNHDSAITFHTNLTTSDRSS